MDLLVAYGEDPAGRNMAEYLSRDMARDGDVYRGDAYDLAVISSPAISADWLESAYKYDGYVFLSRHAAESGRLALTCHSTGNFSDAPFGGNPREVAVPYPSLLKGYMRRLWDCRARLDGFQITLEATHHGPTALSKPCLFVEVGTTPEQWGDAALCGRVASILHGALCNAERYPEAVGFGGTHYPGAFTKMAVHGRYALGTIVPRRALEHVDGSLLRHVLARNPGARTALLDWDGMGGHRRRIAGMLEDAGMEVVRI